MNISLDLDYLSNKITDRLLGIESNKETPPNCHGILVAVLAVTQFFDFARQYGRFHWNQRSENIRIALIVAGMIVFPGEVWLFAGIEESLQWAWLGYELYGTTSRKQLGAWISGSLKQ